MISISRFLSVPSLSNSGRDATSVSLLLASVLAGITSNLTAQTTEVPSNPRIEYQAVAVHQFGSDLDAGGEMSLNRGFAEVSAGWMLDRRIRLSVGLRYGIDAFDFSAEPSDGPLAQDPWDNIKNLELGFSYFRALENGWQVFARPSISLQSESGFDSDALSFSLVGGALIQHSKTLQWGIGLVATSGLERTRAFPFLSVRWEFADRWVLQNPFRPGPAGPAGLEVAYRAENWSLALGGGYRSSRFRIDGSGATKDGIGDYDSIPLFLRYSVQMSSGLGIDLYGGYLLGADLEIEDSNGRSLAGMNDDVGAAPFVAIAVSGQF